MALMQGTSRPDRNFWLGVYNGIFINGSQAFFHPTLVLAPFLAALGAPGSVIGLVPALTVGGWYLPQLFVAHRLAPQPLKMPWYRRMSLVRVLAWGTMTASVMVLGDHMGAVALVVLAMIAVNAVAGGVTGVPFADVTAKVVPHFRLGTFWALRNAVGGALALLAGLVLRHILAGATPFPRNFGMVFLLGTVLAGVSYLSFSMVREPAGKPALRQPFLAMIGGIPGVLARDASLRRFLRVRMLGLLLQLADPFYAVYAIHVLGAPPRELGTYVIIATFAAIGANFVFRVPANRARNVTVLQIGIVLLLAAPVTALLAPSWHPFMLVFAFSAAGNSSVGIAAWNLLYAVAPEEERTLYVGLTNTFLTAPSLAPVLAGAVLPLLGYSAIFAAAAVSGGLALAFAFRFRELRALDLRALGTRG
jgi:hypothetical protein